MKNLATSAIGSTFVFLLLAFVALLSSCGSTDVEVVIPQIVALSDSVLSPGDTLSILGDRFAARASDNVVVFANALAAVTPDSATATFLRVVVPQNANTGALYVSSLGVGSNAVPVEIRRGVGDVWTVAGGAAFDVGIPVGGGGEEYLVVAESATATGSTYAFELQPGATALSPSPERFAPSPSGGGTVDFATAFGTRAREEAVEYIRANGSGKPVLEALAGPTGPPPNPAHFYVLKCTDCYTTSPSSFVQVTASLEYEGSHCLVYADLVQPSQSFTAADYDAFGALFDDQIFPTDTGAFGPPTDIDGNGKVIVLFTPVVNDLTPDGRATSGYIAGFVLVNDLAPRVFPAGTTNAAEIFYAMVPDPNAEYGNYFPKNLVSEAIPGVLAHEFEHMISYGYRLVVLGGGTDARYVQKTWLEEGMAHIAEDLNGMDEQNIRRANLYLAGPYLHSLFGNAELSSKDTLEQRGGIFLFLRYLGDQLGDGIFMSIVRSKNVGTVSIEAVTKVDFHTSVTDYLAALYLDGRGVTSDGKYAFTSFDMQTDFADLAVTDRDVRDGAFDAAVRSATGNFFRLTGVSAPRLTLRVASSENAKMRLTVVRIK